MLTSVTLNFTFSCAYDVGSRQLRVRWRGTVTNNDLYGHYAELMATAEAHGHCRFWLLDMSERNLSDPAFGRWFGNEFAPLAHAALRQPLFIAYVMSPHDAKRLAVPSVQASQHNCVGHDVYSFFFDDEAHAQEWLAHQQVHDEKNRS